MEITIDEWIVHFIFDSQRRKDAAQFLETVFQKCDTFVAVKGGGFTQKIWWMSRESKNWDPAARILAKYFLGSFLWNSDKFHLLDESNLNPVPPEIERETPPDDRYLVKTAMSTPDKLILTTDSRLKKKLSHRQELTIHLVDEFLQQYDC